MEKIDALLPTLVPTFLVLIWAAVVFAIVAGCAGLIAGLVHASKDKSLARYLQTLWANAKAHGELVRSYKDAGVDPSMAPLYLPTPQTMYSPADRGWRILKGATLIVLMFCAVAITIHIVA